MAGFVTDFVRNGGTYMVINTEGGLHTEHLNRVQRSMIASVAIPNLLRLDIREIDFEVTLHYEITGKRMLSQCLKSDWMTMTEFYSFLLQIVRALDHSKEYMLTSGNYLLDENHIFVEESLSSGIIYLVYLPLLDISSEQSVAQALLTLVNRLMTRITDMEGSGIQKIISLCGGELFSIAGLKKLLTSLLLDETPSVEHGTNLRSSEGGGGGVPPAHKLQRNSLNDPYLSIAENLPSRSKASFSFDATDNSSGSRFSGEEDDDTENEEHKLSRLEIQPTYMWLGAALLGAVVWKFVYLDRPTATGLYLSMGVSAAIVLFVLLINRGTIDLAGFFRNENERKWSGDNPQERHDSDFVLKEDKGVKGNNDHKDNRKNPGSHYGGNLHRYEEKWRWNDSFVEADSQSSSAKQARSSMASTAEELAVTDINLIPAPLSESASHREPTAPAPATVLLKEYEEPGQLQAEAAYYLEKQCSGGSKERVPLPKGSFIIGRSEELAQYVEKEAGVSRAHIELMILEASCSIKDLGSRNGTKLNGELIAPYKDYSMEPGDSFSIAEITFHLGRNR